MPATTRRSARAERIAQIAEEEGFTIIFFDGLDSAILGLGRVHGEMCDSCRARRNPVVVYSASRILRCLRQQGMSHEDALDFYGANIECLYAGEGTPMIVDDLEDF